MTRLFLFALYYAIAFALGFAMRQRFDLYQYDKPHMQARMRIFAQEVMLYDPERVPESEQIPFYPPSTLDKYAFNPSATMRVVRERQVEINQAYEEAQEQAGYADPDGGGGYADEGAAPAGGYGADPDDGGGDPGGDPAAGEDPDEDADGGEYRYDDDPEPADGGAAGGRAQASPDGGGDPADDDEPPEPTQEDYDRALRQLGGDPGRS